MNISKYNHFQRLEGALGVKSLLKLKGFGYCTSPNPLLDKHELLLNELLNIYSLLQVHTSDHYFCVAHLANTWRDSLLYLFVFSFWTEILSFFFTRWIYYTKFLKILLYHWLKKKNLIFLLCLE